jgi:hypothetical protein
MWNAKALEVIGNALGRFIKIDEQGLQYHDKRMEKVLVEVDIHVGLLETLEIEWRVTCLYRGWTTWAYLFVVRSVDEPNIFERNVHIFMGIWLRRTPRRIYELTTTRH